MTFCFVLDFCWLAKSSDTPRKSTETGHTYSSVFGAVFFSLFHLLHVFFSGIFQVLQKNVWKKCRENKKYLEHAAFKKKMPRTQKQNKTPEKCILVSKIFHYRLSCSIWPKHFWAIKTQGKKCQEKLHKNKVFSWKMLWFKPPLEFHSKALNFNRSVVVTCSL